MKYMYELFSVIIHKGGCYGGHYHAYIRDIDELGNWKVLVSQCDFSSTFISAVRVQFAKMDMCNQAKHLFIVYFSSKELKAMNMQLSH